ncbi:hypothetical protein HHO41_07560 [Bacillus sp. DNRA2]|uniref:hypothetical protein n=1 Tax=Bacillus sp. DNRA2 TaxID=2723053 RepID=UPI00145DEF32|nr:hypothetical protein [Bacillus sp. DNRA2]NMD70144.1 hypothetical protein [Bacillus sp. DNRA2]
MQIILVVAVLSLLLLFFSTLLVYTKVERKSRSKVALFVIAYIGMAYPVLSSVSGELSNPTHSANEGLGMAFLFTWVLTAAIFVFALVFRYKRNEDEELYVYNK